MLRRSIQSPVLALLAASAAMLGPASVVAQPSPSPPSAPSPSTAPLPQSVHSPLPDLFKRFGIRSIQPATAASDFELPDLAGGVSSLSDYYGNWVVLTFFATWCGPCRSELPTLEALHQQRATDGIVVLGVSVDDPGAALDDFVRQLRLTFPILWDKTKQVGSTYRASSIPISYLVSPEGQLVGVSRGSRDWAALSPMFDGALAAVPATSTGPPASGAYADAAQPVATPSVSDPPTAEVSVDTETPRVGKPFHVEITLHWAGNFQEYLPHPPEILLPDGVVQESVTAESSSRDGRNQLTYRATLRADQPGRYALDPVEIRYTPRLESTPVAGRVLGPTVEVVAPKILGVAPAVAAGGALGVTFLGLLGWTAARKLRRPKNAANDAAKEGYEGLKTLFEEARKKRMAGDGAGYLAALADLDRQLREATGEDESDEAGCVALQHAVEQARFGGVVPPAEELETLRRSLERRLEALRPGKGASEREGLKLKDS